MMAPFRSAWPQQEGNAKKATGERPEGWKNEALCSVTDDYNPKPVPGGKFSERRCGR